MKKILLLMMACLLMGTMVAGAAPAAGNQVRLLHGTIQSITDKDIVVSDSKTTMQIHVGWQTSVVAGSNGRCVALSRLSVGDELTAYYSPKMTRSNPPQSTAYALVMGPQEGSAIYLRAAAVNPVKDGVEVLDTNRNVLLTIGRDACRGIHSIQPGTEMLAWYDTVTMSLPGKAAAQRVHLLN